MTSLGARWRAATLENSQPSSQDLDRARSSIEASLQPLEDLACLVLLTELRVLTMPRRETASDIELALKIYREKLRAYPADAVRHVLSQWPETCEFWPTWREIVLQLEPIRARRRLLLDAVLRPEKTEA